LLIVGLGRLAEKLRSLGTAGPNRIRKSQAAPENHSP
jgi:hypothetical protein